MGGEGETNTEDTRQAAPLVDNDAMEKKNKKKKKKKKKAAKVEETTGKPKGKKGGPEVKEMEGFGASDEPMKAAKSKKAPELQEVPFESGDAPNTTKAKKGKGKKGK